MKSINAVFVYILLTIILCTPNVLTYCGNNGQIMDLEKALYIHESGYTVMTTLSAIPITGAALVFAQALMSAQFGIHLQEVFREMEASLDKNDKDYQTCSDILGECAIHAGVIKSTTVGFSLGSMIPGFSSATVVPRVAASLYGIVLISKGLKSWQQNNCQYITTRDCKL